MDSGLTFKYLKSNHSSTATTMTAADIFQIVDRRNCTSPFLGFPFHFVSYKNSRCKTKTVLKRILCLFPEKRLGNEVIKVSFSNLIFIIILLNICFSRMRISTTLRKGSTILLLLKSCRQNRVNLSSCKRICFYCSVRVFVR